MNRREIQVIPVPACMTVEEAFAEIAALGELVEQRNWWRRTRCRVLHGKRRWAVMEDVDYSEER